MSGVALTGRPKNPGINICCNYFVFGNIRITIRQGAPP